MERDEEADEIVRRLASPPAIHIPVSWSYHDLEDLRNMNFDIPMREIMAQFTAEFIDEIDSMIMKEFSDPWKK